MKAKNKLRGYRNAVLGLPKKTFRDLQQGKDASVPESVAKKYPHLFEEVKKNGNSKQQLQSK